MPKQPDQEETTPDAPRGLRAKLHTFSDRQLPGSGSRFAIAGWIVTAVVLIVVISGVAMGFATSSPTFCGVCHEMRPAVASWRVSPHAEVSCYSCHGTPHRWYGWPLSLMERTVKLKRDLAAHWFGASETPLINNSRHVVIPDSTCEQCHDPARVGTSRFGVQIKHEEHARRNNSCTSCHIWTAHPNPTGDRDSLLMLQCFNCHGLSKDAKAPGDCELCHLKGIDLHPDSHKTGSWLKTHGKIAKTDRKQCAMCHRDQFCVDCHGLEIPHPEGWARGATGHAVVAKRNREVCAKCHTGSTNMCVMCHHKGFDDKKGPWVKQHPLMVEQTGAAFCFTCHLAQYCDDCHSTRAPAASAP